MFSFSCALPIFGGTVFLSLPVFLASSCAHAPTHIHTPTCALPYARHAMHACAHAPVCTAPTHMHVPLPQALSNNTTLIRVGLTDNPFVWQSQEIKKVKSDAVRVCSPAWVHSLFVYMYIFKYICMYVCLFVYMYIFKYICIYVDRRLMINCGRIVPMEFWTKTVPRRSFILNNSPFSITRPTYTYTNEHMLHVYLHKDIQICIHGQGYDGISFVGLSALPLCCLHVWRQ